MFNLLRMAFLCTLGISGGCAVSWYTRVDREERPNGDTRFTIKGACNNESTVLDKVRSEIRRECEDNFSKLQIVTLSIGNSEIPLPLFWVWKRPKVAFVVGREYPDTYHCEEGQFKAVIEGHCVRIK